MSHTRMVWRPLLAVMLTLGVMAAPASAAISATEITSPADRTMFEYDADSESSQTFTISGTSTYDPETAGSDLEIRCYYSVGPYDYQYLTNVTVDGDTGAFSFDYPVSNLWASTCRIRAIPSGTYPSGEAIAPFKGRDIAPGYWNTHEAGGLEENAGKKWGFDAARPTFAAYTGFTSYSNCGMYDMGLLKVDADGVKYGLDMFDCDAFVPSGFNEARAGLMVDGKAALDSSGSSSSLPGYQGGTFTRSTDLSTGNITITEKQNFVRCAPDASAWWTGGECSSHVPTGLALERVITQTHDGRQVSISDDYISTDGAAHDVDAIYIEDFGSYYDNDFAAEGGPSQNGAFAAWYPWESAGFKRYGNYDVVSNSPEAPLTAYFKASDADDEGIYNPVGAITLNTAPDSISWFNNCCPSNGNIVRFKRAVPANGKINISHVFSLGESLGETKGLATPAEDRFGAPRVAITSHQPEQQVDTPTITVSGTARDTVGVTEFTVNGKAVALDANGAWSTTVGLTEGTNTITAIAKDAAGNVTQSQLKVGYKKAVVATAPKPSQVKPAGLRMKLSVKRDRKRPYTFIATGKVLAPKGVNGACATGGVVAVQSKIVRRTVSTRRAQVKRDCTFKVRVSFSKRARLGKGVVTVTPRFEGNLALSRVKGKALTFRAG